jgi:hypothetical protein
MNKEKNIQNDIRLNVTDNVRTFRNNVGIGWTGDAQRTKAGDTIIKDARPLHAGLCKGSSDLIGWVTVEITPDMVGKKIAVFLALEVKATKGRPTKEQRSFIHTVVNSGGIAGIVRSSEDSNRLIKDWNYGVL